MKKVIPALLAMMALAGCAQEGSAPVGAQLADQSFVLKTFNGKPLADNSRPASLRFSNTLQVSGNMCNRFMGQGSLEGNTLTVAGMAGTRMLCVEPQMNQLDNVIGKMLTQGATVTLTADTLTLKANDDTLVYQRMAGTGK
ncbi:META domain-containing protein [Mangrovibacter plantisponsor]|uniref:Heat shock protein HslJ n=1 Tax=Mangrovibacter plantisponsor TaxID=451513 RepID=A0A317Q8W6_9ENTR|nr:META domain-containing protein [Mangrovibacter plantisponsor]PWW10776.1 heat shock protein HslJ [Mangrovibacter plantisponsor]